jgi:hypothetical protein
MIRIGGRKFASNGIIAQNASSDDATAYTLEENPQLVQFNRVQWVSEAVARHVLEIKHPAL